MLIKHRFIDPEKPFSYTKLTPSRLEELFSLIKKHGALKEKFGANYDVEQDPSQQQITMYGFFVRHDGSVFLYQRGSEKTYDDKRLAGKVSIGVGGHMEKQDADLIDTFFREFLEECIIHEGKKQIHPLRGGKSLTIKQAKKLFRLEPIAVIKDQRDEVGKVHLGVVCRISPRTSDFTIQARTDTGEAASSAYVAPWAFTSLIKEEGLQLEGWSQLVLDHELLSNS